MKETINKFKFKDKAIVINASESLEVEFLKFGFTAKFKANELSKNTLVFVNNSKEFIALLKEKLKNIELDSVLWFAYPKGTSKIKTDINRDSVRKTAEEFGITTVAAISINDIWSALRFRPIHRAGK